MLQELKRTLSKEVHIAPLVTLRIAFGGVMLFSIVRFMLKSWVYDFYIAPKVFFPFYGFEWLKPLPAAWMYVVFIVMAIACLGIMLGCFYRIAIISFFLCFLYVELLDKTYYLNHYYLVNILTFLLLLVPAHRYFSIDVVRRPDIRITQVPAWVISIFRWQLCLVYFYAGLSKLTADWLFHAMPLRIWLPAYGDLPVIGTLLRHAWLAYAASWFGAIFDLCAGFLLLYAPTRKPAYFFVVLFHVVTGWLFKIGVFPYIMILVTLVFFSEEFHLRLLARLRSVLPHKRTAHPGKQCTLYLSPAKKKVLLATLGIFAVLQLLIPFRYLLYPGKLYWTEEGYRFSWRVMLMEKSGTIFFFVADRSTGRKAEVNNAQFLTPMQERMMATQPDMILQYAHYLHDYYDRRGINDPIVTAESYVTLNGSGSQLYIDSSVDLAMEHESFLPKKWILPFGHQ